MSTSLDERPSPPTPPARGERVRTAVRTVGELFITVGLVLLLFVAYEVYWTDVVSAGLQQDATAELNREWADGDNPLVEAPPEAPVAPAPGPGPAEPDRRTQYSVPPGDGFAKLYIPSFGADYSFTVLQGTSERSLEVGPGHYTDTAFPGQEGNFAVAGHRVGKGAPFNDLDLLRSCDAVVVETAQNWYVYRVLPMADEVAGWSATRPGCGGQGESAPVAPLGGAYAGVVGRSIVDPTRGDVIAPVPAQPGAQPSAALLTLTTCHPRFSARERMIIHASLVQTWPKDGTSQGQRPPELAEG